MSPDFRAVQFSIDFPEGDARASIRPDSALLRPYRRLLHEGTDPGTLTILSVDSPSGLRVLGSICETVGNRLLFFPAFEGRYIEHHFSRRGVHGRPLDVKLDHLTFELGSRRAHFTEVHTSGRRQLVPGIPQPRPEVAPELYGWFGITARAMNRLEPLPRRLWITGDCPASDLDRRVALLRRSSFGVVLPVSWPSAGSFVQINFFVDFDPTRQLTHITTFIPIGPPELVAAVPSEPSTTSTLYGFSVFGGLQVVRVDSHLRPGVPIRELGIGT